jgi:transcriptional regulator with XRE-family HTH domain
MKNSKSTNRELERKANQYLKEIGHKLYTLRKARKESLLSVGVTIKMSPALISKMEKGLYDSPLIRLYELCKHYQVDIMDII